MDAFLSQVDPDKLPIPADENRAEIGLERFLEAAASDQELNRFINDLATHDVGSRLLKGLFGNSPFLSQCLIREPGFIREIVEDGLDKAFEGLVDGLKTLAGEVLGENDLMKALRVNKRRAAALIAIGDITGLWPLLKVTGALSAIADNSLNAAAAHILRQMAKSNLLRLRYEDDPCRDSGYTILGMGKLGSRELNYSSDVDLIVLYDLNKVDSDDPDALRQGFVRATRDLMRIMDSRTADGYVFRTDLRLRPDPGATPLALSVVAAETYYESLGQNWERAAMIKARAVAGDLETGQAFLKHIVPFIWRKHLDFAAIDDIHSIKRQINAYRGGGEVAINGHDIKIGRGGIREIEFYAQTQQLIWGGRLPDLRIRQTQQALTALHRHDQVSKDALKTLCDAYIFLRTLEHRLQMIDDKQTQKLPTSDEEIAKLGMFMGYRSEDKFRADLLHHLNQVEDLYGRLFEEAPALGGSGSLVFTGSEDDPDTLKTLEGMGFRETSRVASVIRTWHHGRYRATRTTRSRQLLTELMPRLLEALSQTTNPDEAFIRFDTFLSGLPAGVQLFSLFHSNPPLMDLVAEIMGDAPRLSAWLSKRPILLDSVLTADFLNAEANAQEMQEQLAGMLKLADDYQDALDITRQWTSDEKFKYGVQLLLGRSDGESIGPALSSVAETAISQLLPRTSAEFEEAHGTFPGGGLAIIAFGKLGGRELLPGSDLDLVYVYDNNGADTSDGEKPLMPAVYFIRLCQRIGTAINAQTSEGRLYDIDNRLRPAGKAGALATQLDTFQKYYDLDNGGEAWVWEHMALTRARVIYGPPALCQKLEKAIHRLLTQKRDAAKVIREIASMRERIARQYPGNSPWEIKHRPGGLVDVEFIAQYLQLIHAHDHPDILSQNTGTALKKARDLGLLDAVLADSLLAALDLWRRLQALLRLTVTEKFDEDKAPEGQKRALTRASGAETFDALKAEMDHAAHDVRAIFTNLIFDPAKAADKAEETGPDQTKDETG